MTVVYVRGGFLSGSTEKSVKSLPGRKSACGEPLAKRMTGLFYVCVHGPPLWASLGLSQPASQPLASQPASQVHDRFPARNSASQPASQFPGRISVILLVGKLPGHNSAGGEPPWSYVVLLVGRLPGRNSACGEALGLEWISVWNPM